MEIISTIVKAMVEFGSGFAPMFLTMFQSLFLVATKTGEVVTYGGLNAIGITMLTFMGMGLVFFVFRWVSGIIVKKRQ